MGKLFATGRHPDARILAASGKFEPVGSQIAALVDAEDAVAAFCLGIFLVTIKKLNGFSKTSKDNMYSNITLLKLRSNLFVDVFVVGVFADTFH